MSQLGKQKLSEVDAAGRFVLTITKSVQQHWPQVARELKETLPDIDAIPEDTNAGFEFAVAVIATQVQALPNLLPVDQAARIREYILRCISPPELGAYPRDTIEQYQDAWDQSVQKGEPPCHGVASILYDKLGCRSMVEVGEERFKDPLLLMALSEKVLLFGGPWWKNITQQFNLMPATFREDSAAFRFGKWLRGRFR